MIFDPKVDKTKYAQPRKKVVLAFSGGLDTSYAAIYLAKEQGLEVHAALADTGGFSAEELAKIEQRAKALGVASYVRLDVSHRYYDDTIRYMIFGNVLKNGTYPISVSSERISQATAIGEYAVEMGADYICHGSTGAGNDQVRFDMVFNYIAPGIEVIALIRDQALTRQQEIDYLRSHGVDFDFVKAEYSINQGIWGTSVGGKETLTSSKTLPEHAYPSQMTATEPRTITLTFDKGEMTAINGTVYGDRVKAIQELQKIAAPYAIGRDMHVGDTIIGIKGRVGFEAAAPILIIKAHHLLEKHTLTKWQLFWKDQIAGFYGNFLHEGQYFDQVMRDMEAMLLSSQKNVSGDVIIELHPYRYVLVGIESKHDLMSSKFGAYGEVMDGWDGKDVEGFGKIYNNQNVIYKAVNEDNN
ncbi:MAG: argininosuccinate synthase [Rikenellaceae bacterium]